MELGGGESAAVQPLAPNLLSTYQRDSQPTVGANVEVRTSAGLDPKPTHQNINKDSNLYGEGSQGPFLVFIQYKPLQMVEGDLPHNLNIFPLTVGKLIETNKVPGVLSIKKTGRNRIEVSLKSGSSANFLVNAEFLKAKSYFAFIPSFATVRLGLVKGLDNDLTDEEILQAINASNACVAKNIRRLNFRSSNPDGTVVWKPSRTVVITFEGQKLPDRVLIFYNSLPVEVYSLPVMQCRTCCRFGHSSKTCRAKTPRCFRCGEDHTENSCKSERTICMNCRGDHKANDFSCPEFMRQKGIKQLMAKDGISFNDASTKFPKISRNSYATVTATNPPKSPYPIYDSPTRRPRVVVVNDPARSGKAKGKISKKRKISSPPALFSRSDEDPTRDLRWDYFPHTNANGSSLNANRQSKDPTLEEIVRLLRQLFEQKNVNNNSAVSSCSDTSFITVTELQSVNPLFGGNSSGASPR